jgi:signal recognition particle receptor subunit beta
MIVDVDKNEIHLKLVYFGPGLGGKTSNLQYAFERTDPERRTTMTSHATETERMLFFSLVPKSLPPIGGKTVRVSLYTVPGPVFYDESRKLILEGADGVVFVADTQLERFEANVESMEQLETILESHDRKLTEVPLVIQYNKRDLPNRMPLADVDRALNPHRVPHFDAIARTGVGVFDSLKACLKLAYDRIPPPSGSPYRNMV